MEDCTNSHNWQNNTMGIVALMPYRQRSSSPLYSIHAQLCQRAKGKCPHSIFLNSNVVLLCKCQEETILHEIFTTALLWL